MIINIAEVSCPHCGETGSLKFTTLQDTVEVRGFSVTVNKVKRHCDNCGTEFENTKDHDWKREAFDAYRAAFGIPSGDQIRAWREEYGLTQAEVSALLGWGEVTIGRYEKGALPSEAQATQLKSVMSKEGLYRALEEKSGAVVPEKREHLMEVLKPSVIKAMYRKMVGDIYCTSNEVYNGGRQFVFEKAAALISLLSEAREPVTKFNKLMFYSDFLSKIELGHSITGVQYCKYQYGPVPDKFDTLYDCMKVHEVIDVEEVVIGIYPSKIVCPMNVGYQEHLSEEEKVIALRVVNFFKTYNASTIADYSHEERAWLEVGMKDPIPYTYANTISLIGRV